MIKSVDQVTPLHDYIMMSQFTPESDKLIQLPKGGVAARADAVFEVHAVGPGQLLQDGTRAAMLVAAGDIIAVASTSNGVILHVDGKPYIITSQEVVVAKVGHVSTARRAVDPSVLTTLS